VLSIPELANALAAWMEAAGLPRASPIGNSLNCEILVKLALRHPGRVERPVLQGPTPEPGARTARQQLARYAVTGFFKRAPLGWVSLWDYTRCGLRRMVGTFRDMLDDRIEEKLPRVTVPALVICGTRDRIVSQAWAERSSAAAARPPRRHSRCIACDQLLILARVRGRDARLPARRRDAAQHNSPGAAHTG
jgi:pimeloyl-ACP methyl ester carboxylesterase